MSRFKPPTIDDLETRGGTLGDALALAVCCLVIFSLVVVIGFMALAGGR